MSKLSNETKFHTVENKKEIIKNKDYLATGFYDRLSSEEEKDILSRAGNVVEENGFRFSEDKKSILGFAKDGFVEHVKIPEGVERIFFRAFIGQKIKSIEFPKSLTIIESEAFNCYESMLEEVKFNENLKIIGYNSFAGTKLKEVILPNSVEVVEESAFERCCDLEKVVLSESMREISYRAFESTGLKKIVMPSGILEIDNSAFFYCKLLEEVEFNEGLVRIGEEAFMYCESLKSLKLPKSIETIEEAAFINCTSLEDVKGVEVNYDLFEGCTKLPGIEY